VDLLIVLSDGLEGRIHENGGTYAIPPSGPGPAQPR
jgi:hypothetical protein